MHNYIIQTKTPYIIGDKKFLNRFNENFEKILKNSLKDLLLLEYINNRKTDFNAFIEQTLDFFLFRPSIFEKKNALIFYIKCAFELEKKELAKKFQNIDKMQIKVSFPKEKNLFENIILINKFNTNKLSALKSNINIYCQTDTYIDFDKYCNFVKKVWQNEEKAFNKKYKFFLLNKFQQLCPQNFSININKINFVIINEIYSFLYNLNYKNFRKLNNLLKSHNMPTTEKTLSFGIKENGKITLVNFFEIEYA